MPEGIPYTVRVRYHAKPTSVTIGQETKEVIPMEDDPVTLWGGSPLHLTSDAEPTYPTSMLLTVRVDDLGEPVDIYTGGTSGFHKKYVYICTLRPSEIRTFTLSAPIAAAVREPEHADSLVYCCLHQSTYFVVNPPH